MTETNELLELRWNQNSTRTRQKFLDNSNEQNRKLMDDFLHWIFHCCKNSRGITTIIESWLYFNTHLAQEMRGACLLYFLFIEFKGMATPIHHQSSWSYTSLKSKIQPKFGSWILYVVDLVVGCLKLNATIFVEDELGTHLYFVILFWIWAIKRRGGKVSRKVA